MKTSAISALVAAQVDLLVIRLLVSAEIVAVIAAWECERATAVVPVTRSPVTGRRDRHTTLQPDSLWFLKSSTTASRPNCYDSSMLARTVAKSSFRAIASSVVVTGAYRVEQNPGEEMSDKEDKNRRFGTGSKKGSHGKKFQPCKGHKGKNRNGENRRDRS